MNTYLQMSEEQTSNNKTEPSTTPITYDTYFDDVIVD